MDWREAKIRGPHRDPAAQQPDGQQDLDARHLFPEWQEVDLSQHDHPQQAVPYHAERNYPLHYEVNSAGQWAPNSAKTGIEHRPGKQIKKTSIQEYAQTWKEMKHAIPKTRYVPSDTENMPGEQFKQTWLRLCSKRRCVAWQKKNKKTVTDGPKTDFLKWLFHWTTFILKHLIIKLNRFI